MSDVDEFIVDNFTVCNSYEIDEFYNANKNAKSNTLKFLHLNINGCRSNFNELNLSCNSALSILYNSFD